MLVKEFKKLINNIDDDEEIFIRNSVNPVGNISELAQIEISTYSFFGHSVPCVILNTFHNTPENEIDRDADVAIKTFKDTRKGKK